MTTQASPASIKSRFACKAQPQMQPYRMVRRASRSRRSDRAFHARHEIGHGIAVSVKSQDMRLTFYTPTQSPWALSLCDFLVALRVASFGYRKAVSLEPPFVYRGLALIKLPHGGRIRIVAYGLKSPITRLTLQAASSDAQQLPWCVPDRRMRSDGRSRHRSCRSLHPAYQRRWHSQAGSRRRSRNPCRSGT